MNENELKEYIKEVINEIEQDEDMGFDLSDIDDYKRDEGERFRDEEDEEDEDYF